MPWYVCNCIGTFVYTNAYKTVCIVVTIIVLYVKILLVLVVFGYCCYYCCLFYCRYIYSEYDNSIQQVFLLLLSGKKNNMKRNENNKFKKFEIHTQIHININVNVYVYTKKGRYTKQCKTMTSDPVMNTASKRNSSQ